jgi:hypothetical protein
MSIFIKRFQFLKNDENRRRSSMRRRETKRRGGKRQKPRSAAEKNTMVGSLQTAGNIY